jgi:ferritin-like protein|tara:strand:+ start:322 stop:498 length:177 start_codon:yes stop_codon:yes gene_type:complete
MGKMKEVFALHQQELDEFTRYYGEMYKIAYTIGVEEKQLKELIDQSKKESKITNNLKK